MNIKDNPYYWSHIFCVCSSPCLLHHLFSVRKYVYFVHTILTVYLTILHSFLSVSSRRCGACAAPSAEHARPQASLHNFIRLLILYLFMYSLYTLIPNKIHSSTIGDSNQCLLYLFLFSSILIYPHLYSSLQSAILPT